MAISDELRKLVDPNNECCCEHCLSNKCKEWAHIKGYGIITMSDFDLRHDDAINYHKYHFTAYINMNLFPELNKNEYTHLCDVSAKTEPEAAFRACEWILHNKQVVND